jgi:hypothetical protein
MKPRLLNVAFLFVGAFAITASIVIGVTLLGYRAEAPVVTDQIETALSTGTVHMPAAWNRDQQTGIDTWTDCLTLTSWKLDYSNIERLSPEEIERRRQEFDRQKEIAKTIRQEPAAAQ